MHHPAQPSGDDGPVLRAKSFRFPIYFVASDDLFNLKISPLIRYLVAPIPKSKSMADLQAVKGMLRVLREGGAVAVAPEGNRTLNGRQWEMSDAIAKFVKVANVPLVLYNLRGGYGVDPRWGGKIRRGTFFRGGVRRIVYPEEYADMSVQELFALICRELDVDDTELPARYKSRRRAEYIERALYLCPVCGKIGTIRSQGKFFSCSACGTSAEYTEQLTIAPPVAGYDKIYPWFEWERREIVQRLLQGERLEDAKILFRKSVKLKRKIILQGDRVSMDRDALRISGGGAEHVFPLADIDAMTAVGKKKFNFYYRGDILQVRGDKRFCSIKYVHAFDGLKALHAPAATHATLS